MGTMRIPVFVSRPSDKHLQSARHREILAEVDQLMEDHALEARTLGSTDYSLGPPLQTVLAIGRHCAGGLILGLQKEKVGTPPGERAYPTPWNNLEAGILFALRLPLLVWREPGIDGGIFDFGTSGDFVQEINDGFSARNPQVRAVFSKWQAEVSRVYYSLD